MSRALAFSLLVFAAFDWSLPFLDRAGAAALGFAFLALTVGRVSGRARPSTFEQVRQLLGPPAPPVEPVTRETDELLAAYLKADE